MAKNCKHEGCHCEIPSSGSDEHCSDHCKQQGMAAFPKKECACDHVACRATGRVSAAGARNEDV